jgi:hypothetical protein
MKEALTRPSRPAATRLLARILETPDLAEQVQALPAQALAKLIGHMGLEDAGEIVALASTEQLARVFDEDLWRSDRAGQDERFDARRFLLWLEVMLEAGDDFVAAKLADLDEELVTMAVQEHVLVISLEDLAREAGDREDGERVEKALSDCLSEELDDFVLVARAHDGWDTILSAVLALDREHHDLVTRILERCAAMSAERIEETGGLYDVLTSRETLEADVAAEREDRRAAEGHVAPSAAAAFLKLAREGGDPARLARDPLTRAYFRDLRREPDQTARSRSRLGSTTTTTTTTPPSPERQRGAEPPADLARVLVEAGVVDAKPGLALPTGRGAAATAEPLVLRALRRLAEDDATRAFERSEELAYVANVLAAGWSPEEGRRARPLEAVHAAVAAASFGLELHAGKGASIDTIATVLRDTPVDLLFRAAWARRQSFA